MVKNDYGQNLTYQCDSCSRPYPKWQGKCDGCNEWKTITEKIIYSNDLGSKNEWIKYTKSMKFVFQVSCKSTSPLSG